MHCNVIDDINIIREEYTKAYLAYKNVQINLIEIAPFWVQT